MQTSAYSVYSGLSQSSKGQSSDDIWTGENISDPDVIFVAEHVPEPVDLEHSIS